MGAGDGDAGRYERERAFHDDRYRDGADRARAAKFYEAGDASSARYRRLLEDVPVGARVLEYGCGTGSAAFDLAARGVQVLGVDISPVAIDLAEAEAAARGLTDRLTFETMNAEHLALPTGSVDVVCGSGVLHHLDLGRALPEVARVLRQDGWAVFVEPLGHNPIINLYRRRTPEMRTLDEHPLRSADFELAARYFDEVEVEAFNLLTIAAVPFRRFRLHRALRAGLGRADRLLFHLVPPARRYAWVAVLRLAAPRGA